jgi:acetylglutamate kinase
VIRACSIEQARRLLPDLDSGMAPKIESAIKAVEQGVRSVKTIDGRVKHSIVISQLPDIPFGTTIGVTR